MRAQSVDYVVLVRSIRESQGLTQEQLARKLDVGFGTVNSWENGKHRPLPSLAKKLMRIARLSGVHASTDRPSVLAEPRESYGKRGEGDTGDSVPGDVCSGDQWGWPRSDRERRDFSHRSREAPPRVASWRKRTLASLPGDPLYPLITAEMTRDDVRGLLDTETARQREIQEILHILHGTPTLGNHADPVDELVYIVLSRKTPEEEYQSAFRKLKERFPDWTGLLRARPATVEKIIASGGLAAKKVASIRGILEALREEFGSITMSGAESWDDEPLEKFLCSLPEISKKSAFCVMMYSFGRTVFPVDAHVGRVLSRIGIYREMGLELGSLGHKQLQTILAEAIAPPLRLPLHVNLLVHGRTVCTPQKPKCSECDLARFCRSRRAESVQIEQATEGPTSVDLFCGAGGLSEGFRRAGIKTQLASDFNEIALRTYRINHPEIPDESVICGDIRQLTAGEIRKHLRGRKLDVFAGAPPCQGFSAVGNRSKRSKVDKVLQADERNYLFEDFVRLAVALNPKIVLFENVPGMQSAKLQQKSFVDMARSMLEEGGFKTAVWKLDASQFGVPQLRSRIFVIGSATDTLPMQPRGDYSTPHGEEYDRYAPRPISLGHAIYDLPPLAANEGSGVMPWPATAFDEKRARRFLNKFKMRTSPRILFNHTVRYHNERDLELYGLLGQGEDSMHIVERGRQDLMRYRTDAFDDKYMRLDEEIPCKTIVAHLAKDGNGYVHPTQTRSISFREAARVQTFHDGYAFCGSPSDQWTQLGNAVPPVLAESIGRSLRRFLERGR